MFLLVEFPEQKRVYLVISESKLLTCKLSDTINLPSWSNQDVNWFDLKFTEHGNRSRWWLHALMYTHLYWAYKKDTPTANQFHYINLQRNSTVKYIDYTLTNQIESYYEMIIGRGLHVTLCRLPSSYTSIKNYNIGIRKSPVCRNLNSLAQVSHGPRRTELHSTCCLQIMDSVRKFRLYNMTVIL